MMASKVLTNHSACIKHQRVIHALSAMYHIYIPVKSFEVWLHHDMYIYIYIYVYIIAHFYWSESYKQEKINFRLFNAYKSIGIT